MRTFDTQKEALLSGRVVAASCSLLGTRPHYCVPPFVTALSLSLSLSYSLALLFSVLCIVESAQLKAAQLWAWSRRALKPMKRYTVLGFLPDLLLRIAHFLIE